MEAATIELILASTIIKKRRVAVPTTEQADKDDRGCNDGDDDDDDGDDNDDDGNSSYPDHYTILDLSGRKNFGTEECIILAKLLKSTCDNTTSTNNFSFHEVILSKIGIGPRGGCLLADPLSTNRTIVHLDLERNGLGAIGACAIFKALATNTTLRKLNMSLNDVKAATSKGNEEATKALGNALQQNSILTDLILVRSGLGPKGGINLAAGLSTSRSLLRLDLVGNDIMADGGHAIGEALRTNTRLLELNLRWNRIGCGGERGILSLADALSVNISLKILDMSVNELYSEGAIAFGKALGMNQSLVDLCLERNEIGVAGARAIGQALKFNTTLERLVLSGNPMIGDKGAAAIGKSLSEHQTGQSALKCLELVGCGVGYEGAVAFGHALEIESSSLLSLRLEKNIIGPEGAAAIARGLGSNTSLQHLNLSRNGIQAKGGRALALALVKNRTLFSLDISYNNIEVDNVYSENLDEENDSTHIVEAIVGHPALKDIDISSNALESVPIDCQLKLAKLYQKGREINIDLSDNPLSSPPLGRRAGVEGLRSYLKMLLAESTSVDRIRLMVLGFGGVGKSTFCDAVTQPKATLPHFHESLVPLEKWDVRMIASWARRLGTHWAPSIGELLENRKISGKDLPKLTTMQIIDDNETYEPSKMLNDLLETNETSDLKMTSSERKSFARAIGSLMRKGYFSTVGAVKLEGLLELNPSSRDIGSSDNNGDVGRRACSLVDFAGQMEYLVSHQLLLSSLHTLCVVLQPAPSFGKPQNRHHGSWMDWSKFLRALGDRRRGSLLLAISQQDKVTTCTSSDVNAAIESELDVIRSCIPNISDSLPLCLDYRPECIHGTIEDVRTALSNAADVVARDWWVPSSYEKLANLVRRMEDEKKVNREVPIVSRKELHDRLSSEGLHKMHGDPQLFQRGIEYLEAVGDVMTDKRLDCLLLDPISWFASFLAHFIRDDDIVTSVQLDSRFVKRGVVSLEDVVLALQHEYTKPQEQVVQIMSLVCRLELCIRCETHLSEETGHSIKIKTCDEDRGIHHGTEEKPGVSYLFPCLLPMVTCSDLAQHWPGMKQTQNHQQEAVPLVFRGYRFRSRNGFFPPGLFPGLLARCRLLRSGVLSPERMWKNCAVLVFGRHTKVILRIDLCEGDDDAILDVVGVAPTAEELFVGAAKGQASVVVWMTHLVKMFLRKSYPQLQTNEFFLSPFAECHELPNVHNGHIGKSENEIETDLFDPCRSCFNGTEFPAVPKSGKLYKGDHSCEADGCWSQLGVGHKIETMIPGTTGQDELFCSVAHKKVRLELRT